MILGIPRETYPSERRVAIVPDTLPLLARLGIEVIVERGAGLPAGFSDDYYRSKKGTIVESRKELFLKADIIAMVRTPGANPGVGEADIPLLRKGQIIIGFADPLTSLVETGKVARQGAQLFALEMLPRITRAQSMDVLSSMATVAGYKAVILAADYLPRLFPLLMTAAGTISPARVFVIGAGVAGLQAIATARRLGAIVKGYDVRPAVKEQVESLGAKFVEMELETASAEDKGGYAKEMGEDFIRRQREMMLKVVADSDVVITTAAIPGKKAPILITAEMVKAMPAGSVIVDLASERGGNCELTKQGEIINVHDVTIIGLDNLPSMIPYHASQMYSKNVATFLGHLVKDKQIQLKMDDEITRETLITDGGEVVHARVKSLMSPSTAQGAPNAN